MDWVNPYRAGQPVAGGDAFVGRQDVLDEVRRILTRPGAHAASMVGQRRIGKTSVLHRLREWLPTAGPFRPVFYDLSDGVDKPVHETLLRLSRAIAREVGIVAPARLDQAGFREHFLPKAVEQLPAGTSLVLLLDEFDVLARGGGEGAVSSQRDFFQYLRELIERAPPRVGLIVAMGRNIAELEESAGLIFKGIDTVRVGMLTPAQSAELAALGPGLTWTPDGIEELWHQCGGQPYLTQRLCLEIWERAEKPATVDGATVLAACDRTLVAAEGALDWLWNGLSPANQIVAAALAGAGAVAMGSQDIDRLLGESGIRIIYELDLAPKQLEKWDLLRAEGEKWVFRSELLRRWIAQHHPLKEVRRLLDRISDEAEQYYRLAIGAERKGQAEKLREHLSAALENNPNHAGATLMLADLLKQDGDLEGAITRLEGLYAVRPEEARRGLVEALLAGPMDGEFIEQSWTRVLRATAVSAGEPRVVDALARLAPALATMREGAGDFAAAEATYSAAGLTEALAGVRSRRAAHEAKLRAEEELRAALERQYGDAVAQERLGNLVAAERQYAEIVARGGYKDARGRLAALLGRNAGPAGPFLAPLARGLRTGDVAVDVAGSSLFDLEDDFFESGGGGWGEVTSPPPPRTASPSRPAGRTPPPESAKRVAAPPFRAAVPAAAPEDRSAAAAKEAPRLPTPATSDRAPNPRAGSPAPTLPPQPSASQPAGAARTRTSAPDSTGIGAGCGLAVIGVVLAGAVLLVAWGLSSLASVGIGWPGLVGLGILAVVGWGFSSVFLLGQEGWDDLFIAAMCLLPTLYALLWWWFMVRPT